MSLKHNRPGEQIGGGYFVFRRGKRTGRVGVRTGLPFEHPSLPSACESARHLAEIMPGETFEVFAAAGISFRHTPDTLQTETAA